MRKLPPARAARAQTMQRKSHPFTRMPCVARRVPCGGARLIDPSQPCRRCCDPSARSHAPRHRQRPRASNGATNANEQTDARSRRGFHFRAAERGWLPSRSVEAAIRAWHASPSCMRSACVGRALRAYRMRARTHARTLTPAGMDGKRTHMMHRPPTLNPAQSTTGALTARCRRAGNG